MRKHIISLFLLICPTVAWGIVTGEDTGAIIPCSQYSTLQECRTPGCEWHIPLNGGTSSETSHCRACRTQYYNDISNCNAMSVTTPCTCTACPPPEDINLSYEWVASDPNIGLTEKSQCAFTVNCDAGHELAMTADTDWKYTCVTCPDNTYQPSPTTITAKFGNETYIYNIQECTQCGQNAVSNEDKTNCNCKYGYYWGNNENQNTNSGTNDCQPIKRNVYYKNADTGDIEQHPDAYTYVAHPYTVLPNDTDSPIVTPGDSPGVTNFYPKLKKTGYQHSGKWTANVPLLYITNNDAQPILSNNNTKFDAGTTTVYLSPQNLPSVDTGVIFTAVWEAKKFKVTYYNGTAQYGDVQECTYDDEKCKASKAPTTTEDAKYFKGWQCTSGCSDKDTLYKPLEDIISNISDGNDMTLTAQWNECPAGYYCTKGKQEPCPAGSTSEVGSDEITDCYINEKTQFCSPKTDSTEETCFSITGLGNIYHKSIE